MKRAPTRDIILLFVATRLGLMVVTYFGYILLTAPKYSSTGVDTAALFTSWNHWDAANYVRIAQFGYGSRYDSAFFPLFPLLISIIAHPLGDWSYLLVGTLLSNAAFLGALFVIYQLATDILGERVGRRTLLYLCIFPTALYFFAAYNESLFLLLTSGTFLAMRRQKWWIAGILGLFAALTRTAGFLLIIPYLYELWILWGMRGHRGPPPTRPTRGLATRWIAPTPPPLRVGSSQGSRQGHNGEEWGKATCSETPCGSRGDGQSTAQQRDAQIDQAEREAHPRLASIIPAVLPLFLIPLGTALYCIYCWKTFSDPFAFANVQNHWDRHLTWPGQGILQSLFELLFQPFGSFYEAHILLDLSATLGFIVLAVLGWRTLRMSYNIWLGALLLYMLLSPSTQPDALVSSQRFVLEMFPAFITLALLGSKYQRLHQALWLAFPLLQATLSIIFIMNKWLV
jgi:hypothetical protein